MAGLQRTAAAAAAVMTRVMGMREGRMRGPRVRATQSHSQISHQQQQQRQWEEGTWVCQQMSAAAAAAVVLLVAVQLQVQSTGRWQLWRYRQHCSLSLR
jgi:hypothetical protein